MNRMKSGKLNAGMIQILAAVMLVMAAMYFIKKHVQSEKSKVEALAKKNQVVTEMATVVMSKVGIPPQMEIKPEMLTVKKVPKNFLPSDAIKSLEDVKGMYSKMEMVSDEILRQSKIDTKDKALNLNFRIPAGKRAVTIAVSPVKAVAFAVNPHDRIDLIGLFVQEGDNKAMTVLEDIEVLEITTAPTTGDPKAKRTAAPVATLALSPTESEIVALVEQYAQWVIVLRPVGEKDKSDSAGITLAQVMGKEVVAQAPSAAPAAPKRNIQIIKGGSGK